MTYSWRVTVFTQTIISLALFMVVFEFLSPARIQRYHRRSEPLDLYFISVGDGKNTLAEKRAIAEQMKKTAKEYGVQFVVSIGDRGIGDSLFKIVHEEVHLFPSLQVPWYSAIGAHQGLGGPRYFQKEISIPFQHTMDIISIDTTGLEDAINNDFFRRGGQDQVEWLKKALAGRTGDWCIVIGRHPLKNCQVERIVKNNKQNLHDLLLPIFMKYGVHVYLHGQEHFSQYVQDNGIAYIGNPDGSFANDSNVLHNETCSWAKDLQNGFILYRVSPMEMEFYFMDSKGNTLHRTTLHQNGRAVQ